MNKKRQEKRCKTGLTFSLCEPKIALAADVGLSLNANIQFNFTNSELQQVVFETDVRPATTSSLNRGFAFDFDMAPDHAYAEFPSAALPSMTLDSTALPFDFSTSFPFLDQHFQDEQFAAQYSLPAITPYSHTFQSEWDRGFDFELDWLTEVFGNQTLNQGSNQLTNSEFDSLNQSVSEFSPQIVEQVEALEPNAHPVGPELETRTSFVSDVHLVTPEENGPNQTVVPNESFTQFDSVLLDTSPTNSKTNATTATPNTGPDKSTSIETYSQTSNSAENFLAPPAKQIAVNQAEPVELMTPEVRSLGNRVLQSTFDNLQFDRQPTIDAFASGTVDPDPLQAEPWNEIKTTAEIVGAVEIENLESVDFKTNPIVVGIPIEPLGELTEFNIFALIDASLAADSKSALALGLPNERETATAENFHWPIFATATVAGLGWAIVQVRSQRAIATEVNVAISDCDQTVRAAVRWAN